jgi:hypothetical protein
MEKIVNSTPGRCPNGVTWHPSVPISFVVHGELEAALPRMGTLYTIDHGPHGGRSVHDVGPEVLVRRVHYEVAAVAELSDDVALGDAKVVASVCR